MSTTPKSWDVTTYTVDTWTSVVAETADVTTVTLCNTSLIDDITVRVRRGTAEIAGTEIIPAGRSVRLTTGTKLVTAALPLQFSASAAGLHVSADGLVAP